MGPRSTMEKETRNNLEFKSISPHNINDGKGGETVMFPVHGPDPAVIARMPSLSPAGAHTKGSTPSGDKPSLVSDRAS